MSINQKDEAKVITSFLLYVLSVMLQKSATSGGLISSYFLLIGIRKPRFVSKRKAHTKYLKSQTFFEDLEAYEAMSIEETPSN